MSEQTPSPRFMLCVQIQTAADSKAGRPGRFENYLTHLLPHKWLVDATTKAFHQFGAHVVVISAFPLDPNDGTMKRLLEIVK